MDIQKNFFQYQAQTTPFASGFEVSHARGCYIYDTNGKAYLDLVAGVSANTLGHSHPAILKAIHEQVEKHLHVMVYGEYAQGTAVELCKFLAEKTADQLESTYLVNSGTEAIEGALKLAKRYTGRHEIIAAKMSYHGNTHGSMSVSDASAQKRKFRPLLPAVDFIPFNEVEALSKITEKTACVLLETIQGAAGFVLPQNDYLQIVKARCEAMGALLILDEIQPGIGRTGTLFSYEHFGIVPDILVMGKGLGGGMPIGAFMSSREIMHSLSHDPTLGHITTFGGNAVVAASALATLETLYTENLMELMDAKETFFRSLLQHDKIQNIHGKGLMLALELESSEYCLEVAQECMNKGLIVFWQLYRNNYLRITPPLTISMEEIKKGCEIILSTLDEVK